MFLGCESLSACIRLHVQTKKFLARYHTNQWTEFYQTLVDDVVEGTDELFGF